MADFDQYSGFGALNSGLMGVGKALMDLDDRKYKRMEFDAKMKAQEEDRERQRQEEQHKKNGELFELRKAGFALPQDTSNLDYSNLQYDPQYLALKSREGRAAASYDPYGEKAARAEKAIIDRDKARAGAEFGNLPMEKQVQIKGLAEKKTIRDTIHSDIEAALTQLDDPSISDDKKLLVGRELLKTLNSSQGSDAIGHEESKRLGSLLEFKIIPRIGEPGNMFGRDLDLFREQVRNNRDRLAESSQSLQGQIDDLYGRPQRHAQGLIPSGMLKKPGLIQKGADALLPKAGASGNKIMVTNGKQSYYIEPKDLKEAEADGFRRAK